jgi:uncharacterized protein YndB with AHSA1/START domain
MKEKFELEFLFKTSPRVLEKMICTPSGLSEWFADDVDVEKDTYTFVWEGSEEKARLIQHKPNSNIRFKWLNDEDDGLDTYFEIGYIVDPMTSAVTIKVVDFAVPSEKESAILLWEQQIHDLKRVLGA